MSGQRIKAIDPATAPEKTRNLLDSVQAQMGMTPNIFRTYANSPAVLEGILALSSALQRGVLPEKLRERIALTVAQTNGCPYCLSAHSAVGQGVGLSEEEVMDSRRGVSPESRVEKVLRFSRHLVEQSGKVSDADIACLRDAVYSEEEIVEIFANTALHIVNNSFNALATTEVDFPRVPGLPLPY